MMFRRENLRPGDIIHVRGASFLSRRIIGLLGSWGSHDALVVLDQMGQLAIGDAISPFARLTTPLEYERECTAGRCAIRVYRPLGATPLDGLKAADWWVRNVQGKPYDWMAFPRLLFKCWFGDWFKRAAGWEWAWFCTEGVAGAWQRGARMDVFLKTNPTPLTTEKRVHFHPATLEDITACAVAP